MKVSVNVNQEDIKKVKVTWDEGEANKLLSEGWFLMGAGIAHQDNSGFQAKPMFILSKK